MMTETQPQANGQSRRILIVDDNDLNNQYLRTLLTRHNFTVDVASDGQEAIDAIRRRRPDVVLLDVMMPGMSGLEVLKRLRTDTTQQNIPVILITARSHDDDILNGYREGADYYLTKPFSTRQLLHGLGLVLGVRLIE
jgi:DNA-binding response OmpR family regulator